MSQGHVLCGLRHELMEATRPSGSGLSEPPGPGAMCRSVRGHVVGYRRGCLAAGKSQSSHPGAVMHPKGVRFASGGLVAPERDPVESPLPPAELRDRQHVGLSTSTGTLACAVEQEGGHMPPLFSSRGAGTLEALPLTWQHLPIMPCAATD